MTRKLLPRHVAAIVGLLLGPTIANAAETVQGTLHVKAPDMAPGGAPGEIRRLIQSFGDWTLICDDDLKRRSRVCNVSQSFVDAAGRMAFSWSLAATRGGAPVMILRAPRGGGGLPRASVTYGTAKPVEVMLGTCDGALCLGFMPISRDVARRLRAETTVRIGIDAGDGPTTIEASTRGLSGALAALK